MRYVERAQQVCNSTERVLLYFVHHEKKKTNDIIIHNIIQSDCIHNGYSDNRVSLKCEKVLFSLVVKYVVGTKYPGSTFDKRLTWAFSHVLTSIYDNIKIKSTPLISQTRCR